MKIEKKVARFNYRLDTSPFLSEEQAWEAAELLASHPHVSRYSRLEVQVREHELNHALNDTAMLEGREPGNFRVEFYGLRIGSSFRVIKAYPEYVIDMDSRTPDELLRIALANGSDGSPSDIKVAMKAKGISWKDILFR